MDISKSAQLSLILASFLLSLFLSSFFEPLILENHLSLGYPIIAISINLILILLLKKKLKLILFLFLAFFVGLTIYYYHLPIKDSSHISNYTGQKVRLSGWICAQPEKLIDKKCYQLCPIKLILKGQNINNINGKILVSLDVSQDEYNYGQEVIFDSKLYQPKIYPDFNYQAYLANQKIYANSYPDSLDVVNDNYRSNSNLVNLKIRFISFIYGLKQRLLEVSEELFSQPYRALFNGLLFGQTAGLTEGLKEAFTNSGLIHIVVVSGFNITILITVFFKTTKKISINLAFWLGSLAIVFFVLMVGASPPAVRAGIMGWIVLIGATRGRQADKMVLILLSAFTMSLFNPSIVRYDLGFQLSFLATFGLFFFSPILEKYLTKVKNILPDFFSLVLIETLSAQILTLPLILFTFSRISLIAPLANLLVLPLIPYLMFIGLSLVGLGLIILPLAQMLATIYQIVLGYIIGVAEITSSLPLASLEISWFNSTLLLFSYLVIGCIALKYGKETKKEIL